MSELGKKFHMALSVDVDRFKGRKFAKYCEAVTINGRHPTPEELMIAIIRARKQGYVVLPPCDNIKPDGSCAGHTDPRPEDNRP